jgi:hypothetical protein
MSHPEFWVGSFFFGKKKNLLYFSGIEAQNKQEVFMYIRDKYRFTEVNNSGRLGNFYISKIEQYLSSLLVVLDNQLDKRLVRTFAELFISIVRFRNRSFGLLLSELGGFVAHATRAPAGTKRISNLLRSNKWTHNIVEQYLLSKAQERSDALRLKGKQVLFLWDDSVLEKPESWLVEGLCPVGSSKSKRLTRIKPGYYRPPSERVCVPGFEWSSVLMTTLDTIPALVMMRWWTTRGQEKTDRKSVFIQMLKSICNIFKDNILHVLDRGFASEWVLERFFRIEQKFLIRWVKSHLLLGKDGCSKRVSRFFGPKDAKESRLIIDAPRNKFRRVKLFYTTVYHPDFPDKELTLITCKSAANSFGPVHLLTNQTVRTNRDAWKMVFSYMRRWLIEQTFRYNKSELALESPRLWYWENRLKLMAIVSLVYDFLLQILRNWSSMAWITVNTWCPRTGKKLANVHIPLYRLRSAIQAILNEVITLQAEPPPAST